MTEWHTLSGRFTDEELKIILEYAKKNKLTDNQVMRQGVQFIVSILAMKDLFGEKDMGFFRSFGTELKKTTDSPEYQKIMADTVERVAKQYKEEELKKFEVEAKKITKQLDVFSKKRKRGPKPTKKKRGRPKDT